MIRISLVDKFKSLIDLITSSYVFVIVLALFIGVSIYLFKAIKKDQIKAKKICVLGYSAVIITIAIAYNSTIFNLIDYLINNIFVILCFPNLAVYITLIILLNIIMIKTVFKKDLDSYIKAINIGAYSFIHFMLILILDTIIKNNINVYSEVSIYTNKNLLNLVELSIGVFVVWGIILGIIHVIKKLTNGELKEKNTFHLNAALALEPITIFDQNHMLQTESIYISNSNTLVADATMDVKQTKEIDYENMSIDDYKKLKHVLVKLGKEGK